MMKIMDGSLTSREEMERQRYIALKLCRGSHDQPRNSSDTSSERKDVFE
jgi:hypothetical protein